MQYSRWNKEEQKKMSKWLNKGWMINKRIKSRNSLKTVTRSNRWRCGPPNFITCTPNVTSPPACTSLKQGPLLLGCVFLPSFSFFFLFSFVIVGSYTSLPILGFCKTSRASVNRFLLPPPFTPPPVKHLHGPLTFLAYSTCSGSVLLSLTNTIHIILCWVLDMQRLKSC